MSAVISECGKYRYVLSRHTGIVGPPRPCLFIMLNPSTADAKRDDPTIRKCLKFAKREKCTNLVVVNLFAYRTTNPITLKRVSDPVGPENDRHIFKEIDLCEDWNGIVVAAWGNNGRLHGRGKAVEVMLEKRGIPIHFFNLTKNGQPAHPLYQRDDAPLRETHCIRSSEAQ